jgi:hypothetical protein
MVSISDGIRPFWAFGINNIPALKTVEFSRWLSEGANYQIYSQIQAEQFELHATERRHFLLPISHDCNRFSTSCFESAIKIQESALLPKAKSWLFIKLYYATFYAAHYILRVLGFSLTQLESPNTTAIEKIADLFGYKNNIVIHKGFYVFDYSDRSNIIKATKAIKTGEDGSHGAMWKLFAQKLSQISNDILHINSSADYQQISTKLSDCVANLKYMGNNNGGWLSKIRNDINYKHKFGIWYPYEKFEKYYSDFDSYLDDWKGDPLEIELKNLAGKELIRFISTCQFIIGMARDTTVDMSKRCSNGRSFQINGPISLLNLTKIK